MKVLFNNLKAQYEEVKIDFTKLINELFNNSSYINGPLVSEFEKQFARYIGVKYAIGISNGTDGIMLALKALDLKGSTIIFIPANTFIATILGAEQAIPNAKIKLIDCDENYLINTEFLKEKLQESRFNYDNCVIMPVHLYGKSCNMDQINKLAKKYKAYIIEDASQSHGARYKKQMTGSFGKAGVFSLYPGKNLGAIGDAGIITTNCKKIYNRIKNLRNLGSEKKYIHTIKGFNHRLDSIQAAILIEKLKKLDEWNSKRISIAHSYIEKINNPNILLPSKSIDCDHVYHIFCIRVKKRSKFTKYLEKNSIEYGIHYPVPIEKMKIYSNLLEYNNNTRIFSQEIISLPMHPFISDAEIDYICNILNKF
jgi:dTDP-4-amino-4,6-dideoxygalactose transaminase